MKIGEFAKRYDMKPSAIRLIPLKKEVIDLFIDDFSGNNYTFTYNENLYTTIAPLLRHRGMMVGCFVNYSAAPKSLRNFR